MPRGLIPEAFVQQSELVVWNDAMTAVYKHDTCAICHEAFSASAPDICRVLACSHVFHAQCVDLWFVKATFCPLCKNDFRTNLSQRSLGQSHTSSQRSLGSRSLSSLRSGQLLVGHSNSDPALLRVLQGTPVGTAAAVVASGASLTISFSDRSLSIMGSSRSERSLGILSASSSGALPAVQEVSDESRAADSSQRSHSSNPSSPFPASPVSATFAAGSRSAGCLEPTVHLASPFYIERSSRPMASTLSPNQQTVIVATMSDVANFQSLQTIEASAAEPLATSSRAGQVVCARSGRPVQRPLSMPRVGSFPGSSILSAPSRAERPPMHSDSRIEAVAKNSGGPAVAPPLSDVSLHCGSQARDSSMPPAPVQDKLSASFRSAGTASSVASCASAGTPPTAVAQPHGGVPVPASAAAQTGTICLCRGCPGGTVVPHTFTPMARLPAPPMPASASQELSAVLSHASLRCG